MRAPVELSPRRHERKIHSAGADLSVAEVEGLNAILAA
jgi:hypothetical protein